MLCHDLPEEPPVGLLKVLLPLLALASRQPLAHQLLQEAGPAGLGGGVEQDLREDVLLGVAAAEEVVEIVSTVEKV